MKSCFSKSKVQKVAWSFSIISMGVFVGFLLFFFCVPGLCVLVRLLFSWFLFGRDCWLDVDGGRRKSEVTRNLLLNTTEMGNLEYVYYIVYKWFFLLDNFMTFILSFSEINWIILAQYSYSFAQKWVLVSELVHNSWKMAICSITLMRTKMLFVGVNINIKFLKKVN